MSIYIASRAHGLKTRLLPMNTYEAIASLKTLRDLFSFLSPTEYQRYLGKVEDLDPKVFHRAYSNVFAERINLVFSIPLPRSIKLFITSYLRKYDFENVFRILNGLKSGKDVEDIKQNLVPINFMKVNIDELMGTKNVERAIETLRESNYGITDKGVELYKKFDSLLAIEADMKKYYYRKVIEAIRGLNRLTRNYLESFIKTIIEVDNIFTVLSSYLYNYDPELVDHMLLPYTKRIAIDDLKRIVSTKNIRELQSMAEEYASMINHLLTKKEFDARLEANKMIVKLLEKIGLSGSMDLSYVVYVIELMEYEYRNLTYLTYMIHFNFPEVERKTLLSA